MKFRKKAEVSWHPDSETFWYALTNGYVGDLAALIGAKDAARVEAAIEVLSELEQLHLDHWEDAE